MKITGKLTKKLNKVSGTSKTGKDWEKQEFILETNAEYNSEICVATFGETMQELQNIKEGTELEINLNISSKEFNGKYYHNITAWKITPLNEVKQENKEDNLPF